MGKPRAGPLSVLLVDDHRAFAEALALALQVGPGYRVTVATTGEAVSVAERDRPQVILMDVESPRMSGLDAIRRIRASNPDARVVVLSDHDGDQVKAQAVAAGAAGYVSKSVPLAEVAEVAGRAARGDQLLDRDEVERLLRLARRRRHERATERQRLNRLTPRQREILDLLTEGLGPRDIAGRLGLSPYTVRTHLQNILTRLDVHSRVQAVALAMRHGNGSAGG